jgi:nucleoside-diphosphate-sugar epimerase
MHVYLAGATGAIGRALIPLLIDAGHTVTGTTTRPQRVDELRSLGATPVVVDGLDRDAVLAAVAAARPDAIVHQMTALTGLDVRRIAQGFAQTNRLRTAGTDHLLEAARRTGVPRVIAQSFAGWPFAPVGGPVKTEEDPLDDDPPAQLRAMLDAIRHVETVVPAAGGVVLRYGPLYGAGTGLVPGGDQWELVAARKFPLIGDGGAVWSFVTARDAARATRAALQEWTPGEIYHVVDDDPAPAREWLPALAAAVGARPPRHVPRWVGGLLGAHLVRMMCDARGASNAKARERLGWAPEEPSWRDGFAQLRGRPIPA